MPKPSIGTRHYVSSTARLTSNRSTAAGLTSRHSTARCWLGLPTQAGTCRHCPTPRPTDRRGQSAQYGVLRRRLGAALIAPVDCPTDLVPGEPPCLGDLGVVDDQGVVAVQYGRETEHQRGRERVRLTGDIADIPNRDTDLF